MGGRGASLGGGQTINYTNVRDGNRPSASINEAVSTILSSPRGTRISVRTFGFGSNATTNFEITSGNRGLARVNDEGRHTMSWKLNRQNIKSRILGGISGTVTITPPRTN